MPEIVVSPFVKRQTADSRFSHFEGSWDELRDMTEAAFNSGNVVDGYRPGVVKVQLPPTGFRSGVAVLKEGDKLIGVFEPRQEGETPRKSTCVVRPEKARPVSVEIILYRHDVLLEGNEHSCDAEWEIISINANPVEGEMPIHPATAMANFFLDDGGTDAKMTDAEFVAQLREAHAWWKDKAFIVPAS